MSCLGSVGTVQMSHSQSSDGTSRRAADAFLGGKQDGDRPVERMAHETNIGASTDSC
jgi:hypothetical protein